MKATDDFFLKHPEPVKAVLLAMREIILQQDTAISCVIKYGMPFFCYKAKMFCYLWVQKKSGKPYLGIVEGKRIEHPDLIIEKRSRMKIMLLIRRKIYLLIRSSQFLSMCLTFTGMVW